MTNFKLKLFSANANNQLAEEIAEYICNHFDEIGDV